MRRTQYIVDVYIYEMLLQAFLVSGHQPLWEVIYTMSPSGTNLNDQLQLLCKQSAKLIKLGDYDRAISKYYECLTILPKSISKGSVAAFLNAAIGECYWAMKDYDHAGEAFADALDCETGDENPNIAFRIGQCLVECDHEDMAPEYFDRACRLGGESLFADEDEKYYYIMHPDERPVTQPEPEPVPVPEPEVFSPVETPVSSNSEADFFEPSGDIISAVASAAEEHASKGPVPKFPNESKSGTDYFSRGSAASAEEATSSSQAVSAENDAAEEEHIGFFQRLFGKRGDKKKKK